MGVMAPLTLLLAASSALLATADLAPPETFDKFDKSLSGKDMSPPPGEELPPGPPVQPLEPVPATPLPDPVPVPPQPPVTTELPPPATPPAEPPMSDEPGAPAAETTAQPQAAVTSAEAAAAPPPAKAPPKPEPAAVTSAAPAVETDAPDGPDAPAALATSPAGCPSTCRNSPLRCPDDSKLVNECCEWSCESGAKPCYTWADEPREKCEDGTAPTRVDCAEFECPNNTGGGRVAPGPVIAAGRVYMPLEDRAVRSVVQSERAARAPFAAGRGSAGGLSSHLLASALQELGLEADLFDPMEARSAYHHVMESPSMFVGDINDVASSKHWFAQAQDEHASVAAFAMLQLELLAHGAPLDLVSRVLTASQEEVDHVSACQALAGGAPAGSPLTLPAHELRAQLQQDFRRLLQRSLREGAVPEGEAALRLWRDAHAEHRAGRATRARLLWAMGHDEARHAELAHDIALWAAETCGAEAPVVHVRPDGSVVVSAGEAGQCQLSMPQFS